MNVYSTTPAKKSPYRRCGIAMAVYAVGVTGFAVLNIALHHSGMTTHDEPALHLGTVALSNIDLFECVETLFLFAMAFVFGIKITRNRLG